MKYGFGESLEKLEPMQKRIIKRLYLLTPPEKLSDVATQEGVSCEQVKQLLRRAFLKLKQLHEDEV